jgi:hypothetical protein
MRRPSGGDAFRLTVESFVLLSRDPVGTNASTTGIVPHPSAPGARVAGQLPKASRSSRSSSNERIVDDRALMAREMLGHPVMARNPGFSRNEMPRDDSATRPAARVSLGADA